MKKTNTQSKRNEDPKGRHARSKRVLLALTAIALVLILLTVGLIWYLVKTLSGAGEGQPKAALEPYLAEKWTVFQLRSWDPESGSLELDYPLRFTYAQMEKYGASLDELRELPAGNRTTADALKAAAYEDCGVTVREITVYGLTNDGETAYTVHPDGTVEACWNNP